MQGVPCWVRKEVVERVEREERFIEGRITNSYVDLDWTRSIRSDLTGGNHPFSGIKRFSKRKLLLKIAE